MTGHLLAICLLLLPAAVEASPQKQEVTAAPPAPAAGRVGDAPGTAGAGREQDKPAPDTSDSPPSWTEAQAVLLQAEQLFAVANYDAALLQFARAYDLLTGHPRRYVVLNNIAVCHERLFRYDEAVSYYERYVAEAPPAADDIAQVEAIIETLQNLLATLTVTTNVPGTMWVDGRSVGPTPGQFRIPSGRRVVELSAPGRTSQRLQLDLHGGERRSLAVTLEQTGEPRGLDPGYFYVGVGATALLGAGAGVLGALFLSQRDAARERSRQNMGLPTATTGADERSLGQLAVGADIALVAAVVAGATTLVLYLLTDWDDNAPPSSGMAVQPPAGTLTMHRSFTDRRSRVAATSTLEARW